MVSLRVDKGQVAGLLGPNGAGKTTSFYMIVGIERPSSATSLPLMARILQIFLCINGLLKDWIPTARGINLSFHVCRGQYSCHATITAKSLMRLKLSWNHWLKNSYWTCPWPYGDAIIWWWTTSVEIARCLALEPNFILLDEPLQVSIQLQLTFNKLSYMLRTEYWYLDYRP